MPYTSIAIFAKYHKKNIYYYDPTSMIDKNDPAAHGIQIISGKQELIEICENVR